MGIAVYAEHGVHIRRILLNYGEGPGYEIHVPDGVARLTWVEFRKMVLVLAEHLMRIDV